LDARKMSSADLIWASWEKVRPLDGGTALAGRARLMLDGHGMRWMGSAHKVAAMPEKVLIAGPVCPYCEISETNMPSMTLHLTWSVDVRWTPGMPTVFDCA